MAKTTVVFTFPPRFQEQPLTYRMIKEYDLMINILHAEVKPYAEGHLVLELAGTEEDIERGLKLARSAGVTTQPLSDFVSWDEDQCSHCTACVGQCPTHALSVDRESMQVSFDAGLCCACGLCVGICPMGAMQVELD